MPTKKTNAKKMARIRISSQALMAEAQKERVPPRGDEIASLNKQERAIAMYLEGASTTEIAQELGVVVRMAQYYVREARLRLISDKKGHFDGRLASLLDVKCDAIEVAYELLSDKEFLQTADPDRIDAIARTAGIATDKVFLLLTAFGGRSTAVAASSP